MKIRGTTLNFPTHYIVTFIILNNLLQMLSEIMESKKLEHVHVRVRSLSHARIGNVLFNTS